MLKNLNIGFDLTEKKDREMYLKIIELLQGTAIYYETESFLENKKQDYLCEVLRNFCIDENLPQTCAYELRQLPDLTDQETLFLDHFLIAWDKRKEA